MSLINKIATRLQNDMTAAIDTGNLAEAKLVLTDAEEIFDNGGISSATLAEITFDYIQFEDTQTVRTEYTEV